jgi:hypothetical protein
LIFGERGSISHKALDVRRDLAFHVLGSEIVDFTSITAILVNNAARQSSDLSQS